MKRYKTPATIATRLSAIALLAVALPAASFANDANRNANNTSNTSLKEAAKATTVEGMDFHAKNGDDVGSVDDIVFSTETGKIQDLIVDTGFLGIGGEEHRVSVDKLQSPSLDPYDMKTSLSVSEFKDTPKFDRSQLDQRKERSENGNDAIKQGEVMALDAVGRDLRNESGERLGEVDDWVVDVKNSYVPFMIVRRLKPLGTTTSYSGYDYFAIASDRVVGIKDDDVIASVSPEELIDAERIDDSTTLEWTDEDSPIYQFRYDKSAVVSQN